MYAVIKTGGKQYRVSEGDTLQVEKLTGEPGEEISFDEVLLVAGGDSTAKVGKPVISGAKVKARILSQERGPKIIVFKMRRRKNYRNKTGHRQPYTRVQIVGISA
jgi:large subunit ribosomal protein L21